jgi:hypothetical protein
MYFCHYKEGFLISQRCNQKRQMEEGQTLQ